jgi:hypothetical protein
MHSWLRQKKLVLRKIYRMEDLHFEELKDLEHN